jgi:2-polyprenyl-3-methyl-5-hydroxy-6-metoxy-1,4-benzoquinol methylase
MGNWKETSDDSIRRWEANADFWDERMGEHSNRFHREVVRPDTERLLSVNENDKILDIACGNGNYSKRLVELGANVIAFDYSKKMIENAKKRCSHCIDRIDFHVIDATDKDDLEKLSIKGPFDKAVSNMAIMDIADIAPLFNSVSKLLKPGGIFVFSTIHPCFQSPGMRRITEIEDVGNSVRTRHGIQVFEYINSCCFEGNGIVNQPVPQLYYHRPLSELFDLCFNAGFVINGVSEPVFEIDSEKSKFDWNKIPPIIIMRLQKIESNK